MFIRLVDRTDFQSERRCSSLDNGELPNPGGVIGIAQDCHTCHIWRDLFEKFWPFASQGVFELNKARGITAWTRHSFNEAVSHGVGYVYENDRHSPRRL